MKSMPLLLTLYKKNFRVAVAKRQNFASFLVLSCLYFNF